MLRISLFLIILGSVLGVIACNPVLKSEKKPPIYSENIGLKIERDSKSSVFHNMFFQENANNSQHQVQRKPLYSKEELKDNLEKIKSDITDPDAMKAIGESIQISEWNKSLYLPNQYTSGLNQSASARRIDTTSDTNDRQKDIINPEITTDPNHTARYGSKLDSNKMLFILEMNDRAPIAFGTGTSTNGNVAVASELYSLQNIEKKTSSLYGSMRIEISKNKNDYISLIFGKKGKIDENGSQLYIEENDIIVDQNNKPISGTLSIEFNGKKSVDATIIKITKEYDFAKLSDTDKEKIKKLELFNL